MADEATFEQRMAKRCRRLAADYQRATACHYTALAERIMGMYERAVDRLGYDPLSEHDKPTAKLAADYGLSEHAARRAIRIVDEGVATGATVDQMVKEIGNDREIWRGYGRSFNSVTDIFVRIAKDLGYR